MVIATDADSPISTAPAVDPAMMDRRGLGRDFFWAESSLGAVEAIFGAGNWPGLGDGKLKKVGTQHP